MAFNLTPTRNALMAIEQDLREANRLRTESLDRLAKLNAAREDWAPRALADKIEQEQQSTMQQISEVLQRVGANVALVSEQEKQNAETVDFTDPNFTAAMNTIRALGTDATIETQESIYRTFKGQIGMLRQLEPLFKANGFYFSDLFADLNLFKGNFADNFSDLLFYAQNGKSYESGGNNGSYGIDDRPLDELLTRLRGYAAALGVTIGAASAGY